MSLEPAGFWLQYASQNADDLVGLADDLAVTGYRPGVVFCPVGGPTVSELSMAVPELMVRRSSIHRGFSSIAITVSSERRTSPGSVSLAAGPQISSAGRDGCGRRSSISSPTISALAGPSRQSLSPLLRNFGHQRTGLSSTS